MRRNLLCIAQLLYAISFKKNIWAKHWWGMLCFNHSTHKWFKIYSTILPCQAYETLHCCMLRPLAALSCEQFPTVLRPIMTSVAVISTRWQCQHTFPNSGRTILAGFWQLCFHFITYHQVQINFIKYIKMPTTFNNFQKHLPILWYLYYPVGITRLHPLRIELWRL